MSDPVTPLTLSVMYCLDSEQGHIFSYNRTFGEAVRTLGWEHRAAIRAAARIAELPPGWTRTLGSQQSIFKGGPLLKVEKELRLITTLARYLRDLTRTEPRPIILVLEWFHLVHLVAFAASLLAVPRRNKLSALFVYRFGFTNNRDRVLYRWVNAAIKALLGANQVILFSETDVVAEEISQVFKQPVHLLPMPQILQPTEQTSLPAFAGSPARAGKLVCWWPGVPAAEKGLAVIERLTTLTGLAAQQLVVVADARAQLSEHPGGCAVYLLNQHLTRAEYAGWMHTADLALLPYAPLAYVNRTSGPFADAISLNKIPVVTDGTWMARELRRYDLAALIIDWDSPTLPQTLLNLAHDPAVRTRLDRMRADYLALHSVRGYARTLKTVLIDERAAAHPQPPAA